MSLSIYCAECGNKNEYSLTRPKFCCNCGEAFNKAFINTAKAKIIKITTPKEDVELDIEVFDIPELDPNSIKVSDMPKKLTVGEINKASAPIERNRSGTNSEVSDLVNKIKK